MKAGIDRPDIRRVIDALTGNTPDRVPYYDMIDPVNVNRILGRDSGETVRSFHLRGTDAVAVAMSTHMDFVFAVLRYWTPKFQTAKDLDTAPPLDVAEFRERVVDHLEAVRGTGLGVAVGVAGPFYTTYMRMLPIPIQSFMIALYDDRKLVERAMDIQVEGQIRIIEAIADLPIAFAQIDDDVCDNTGFMVAPRLMEEVWEPRFRRIVEALGSLGVPVMCHCCGKLDPVLPKLVDMGIAGISPIQPNCNEIYAIKKAWGDKISLVGNINIQDVLPFGTPAEVERDVREHIERLSVGGRYMVASSHSIVDAIPHENMMAMVNAVLRYGRVG